MVIYILFNVCVKLFYLFNAYNFLHKHYKIRGLTWFERPKLKTLTLLNSASSIASSISLFNVSLCHLKRYYKSLNKNNIIQC